MMNAEDAGSSSASGGGGGASKKRSNEENKINVYWKGFLDAQIQAEHANLRAIAHAGRLDTLRRSIYWGYKQNPNACTNVALAVNCSSADKFLEYTLEASLIPTRGIKKQTWKNQVSAYNKLLKKCSEFEKWTEDNPELFDSEEFVERFVQANIECKTWTQIHAKINTPKVLPQAAMASLTQGVENNKAAESKETSSRGSRKAAAKAKAKMEEVEDDGDEEYDEGTEKKEETDALEEKSTDPQKAKLMTFYEQVKTKKGKMDEIVEEIDTEEFYSNNNKYHIDRNTCKIYQQIESDIDQQDIILDHIGYADEFPEDEIAEEFEVEKILIEEKEYYYSIDENTIFNPKTLKRVGNIYNENAVMVDVLKQDPVKFILSNSALNNEVHATFPYWVDLIKKERIPNERIL